MDDGAQHGRHNRRSIKLLITHMHHVLLKGSMVAYKLSYTQRLVHTAPLEVENSSCTYSAPPLAELELQAHRSL